jgi:hypothetical protein
LKKVLKFLIKKDFPIIIGYYFILFIVLVMVANKWNYGFLHAAMENDISSFHKTDELKLWRILKKWNINIDTGDIAEIVSATVESIADALDSKNTGKWKLLLLSDNYGNSHAGFVSSDLVFYDEVWWEDLRDVIEDSSSWTWALYNLQKKESDNVDEFMDSFESDFDD